MRLLLDTHVFLWWVEDAPPLSRNGAGNRLLVAQAIEEKLPVVTSDPLFAKYGVKRIW